MVGNTRTPSAEQPTTTDDLRDHHELTRLLGGYFTPDSEGGKYVPLAERTANTTQENALRDVVGVVDVLNIGSYVHVSVTAEADEEEIRGVLNGIFPKGVRRVDEASVEASYKRATTLWVFH